MSSSRLETFLLGMAVGLAAALAILTVLLVGSGTL